MYYDIDYEIASIILLIVLIIARRRYFKSENSIIRQFMTVIILLIITCVIDIIAALSSAYIIPLSDEMMLVVESIYMLMALFVCFMQLMVVSRRMDANIDKIRVVNFLLVAFITLILCFNVYGHFIFEYKTVNGVREFIGYTLFYLIYIVYSIFFIQMAIVIILNKNKVRKQTFKLITGILIFPIFCIIIQSAYDNLLLSGFGGTLAFLIYSFSVEDQDYDKLQLTMAELEETRKLQHENEERIISANKVKSLFMENISEELKRPLNEILNICDDLKKENDDKAIDEYTQKINDSGKQLLSFIDELIVAAKQEDVNEAKQV